MVAQVCSIEGSTTAGTKTASGIIASSVRKSPLERNGPTIEVDAVKTISS